MIQFIRLTRPLNLFIVALTMYGLGWYFEGVHTESSSNGISSFSFFLLVLSTIMIAAAGNIINDYFDLRADRINKPEKVIIGKYIKRRVAIVTHWTINFAAFSIAIYLSWKLDTFWYLFIHLLCINILWYYSSYFKRKFLIGNILVASLTALVPLMVGLYFFHNQVITISNNSDFFPFYHATAEPYVVYVAMGLAGFAFILNLAREIVKDMEDVIGDKLIRANTVPIRIGFPKTKVLISIILIASIASILFIWIQFPFVHYKAATPLFIAALFVLIALILLLNSSNKSQFKRINSCIKIAMVVGALSPVFWKILLIYG